ncbi:MAG: amidohydrolase family protein [Parasphingorhabdus sp.]|uniref:amidohydrolase family protein n=1 Tax=Parasphingorhabdus sp. TaxID=2709688 RepID=UPI003002C283
MKTSFDLIIRNACDTTGNLISVGIRDGIIAAIGPALDGVGAEYDAQQQTLGSGLHDHHCHLLATAARMESVDLTDCRTEEAVMAQLRAGTGAPDGWIRAFGYDERAAGLPDRNLLDKWLPQPPLRIQDRTGAYWLLNSAAIARLGEQSLPSCVERDADGLPTGRIWRGDKWLRERIGGSPPSLSALGKKLARWGVTGVTDASASNGTVEAKLLAGAMPQRLVIMGSEELPAGEFYSVGPVKLILDENDLPPIDQTVLRIGAVRKLNRNVAAHCATLGELLFYLEALQQSGGARSGDRIEHGSIIPESMIGDIASAGLIVVTQPNFIHDRGDRYRAQIDEFELNDLYRLGSLLRGGVRVLGGSDAPYGDINPWIGLRAALDRRTRNGTVIGAGEAVDRRAALALYQNTRLAVGAPADLILYSWPEDTNKLGAVSLTLIGGNIAWQA